MINSINYRSNGFQPIVFYFFGGLSVVSALLVAISSGGISWGISAGLFLGLMLALNGGTLSKSMFAVNADGSFSWIGHDGKKHDWTRSEMRCVEKLTLRYGGIPETQLQVHLTDGK